MTSKPQDLEVMLSNMANTPKLLSRLIEQISSAKILEKPAPDKWSIHVHAAHLVDLDPMFVQRFTRFTAEEHPVFAAFVPSDESGEPGLQKRNLSEELKNYPHLRSELIEKIRSLPDHVWARSGEHGSFDPYTPEILVRHIMLHDYLHMYRIETAWLVKKKS